MRWRMTWAAGVWAFAGSEDPALHLRVDDEALVGPKNFDVDFECPTVRIRLGVNRANLAFKTRLLKRIQRHDDLLADMNAGDIFFVDGGAHDQVLRLHVGNPQDHLVHRDARAL